MNELSMLYFVSLICYTFYPARSDALFSNYFEEDLLLLSAGWGRERQQIGSDDTASVGHWRRHGKS